MRTSAVNAMVKLAMARAFLRLAASCFILTSEKLYFVKIYKRKEKFNKEHATRTGGYEIANSLASRTRSADLTEVSNASSKPPTNITTNQMSPSNQQTMIKYTNSLESELDNAKEYVASMTTTQEHSSDAWKTNKKNVGAEEQVHGNDEQRNNKNRLGEEVTQQQTQGEGKYESGGEVKVQPLKQKKECTTRTTNFFRWRKTTISVLRVTNLNRIRRCHTVMI